MLGVVLGVAVIILFLFLSSRNTIDEPSLSGGATTQTQSQPAAPEGAEAQAVIYQSVRLLPSFRQ